MSRRVYLDESFAAVSWNAKEQAVQAEWKGWATSPEYRAAHEAMLLGIRENLASRLLADCRLMKLIVDADQRWTNEVWLPRALAAGLHRAAVLLPQNQLAKLHIDDLAARSSMDAGRYRFFATMPEACAWLVSPGQPESATVPARPGRNHPALPTPNP
jgi:hypothetical protein